MSSPYVRESQSTKLRSGKTGDPIKLIEQLQDYIVKLQNAKDAAPRRRPSRRFYDKFSFEFQQSRDLPPSIRAIVEDNRMLRGLLKQWKGRCQAAETLAHSERTRCEQCREELATLRKTLPKEEVDNMESLEDLRKSKEELEKKLETKENFIAVLQKKQQVDWKLHQAELAVEGKKREALADQISLLKKEIQVLERQKRSEAVEAKRVTAKFGSYRKKAAEWKKQLDEALVQIGSLPAGNLVVKQSCDKGTFTETSGVEEKVLLMLCVVTEEAKEESPAVDLEKSIHTLKSKP